jgi:hypothetical protein
MTLFLSVPEDQVPKGKEIGEKSRKRKTERQRQEKTKERGRWVWVI